MKTLHWITFALKFFFAKIIFCTCTYGKISISQEFFSVQKSWSCLYFISLSYWKKAIKLLVSLAFVTSSKQKKWKQFQKQELKFGIFSEYFSMAFRNTLLQQIEEIPDLSGHWLYNLILWEIKMIQRLRQTKLAPRPNNSTLTNSINTMHLNN